MHDWFGCVLDTGKIAQSFSAWTKVVRLVVSANNNPFFVLQIVTFQTV